jgi:two-component system nitrogen regulation response regulator NtrX
MILVVDDDDDVRETIVGALQTLSYRTREAADGEQALALFRAKHPALVILDSRLAGTSGLDVLEEMKSVEPRIPLIVATGFVEDAELWRANEGVPVLLKPFRLAELAELVEQVLAEAEGEVLPLH